MAFINNCHICMSEIDKENNNVSYNLLEMTDLAYKLAYCTNLSVELDAELPCALCQACRDNVERFYAFRLMCNDAYERWSDTKQMAIKVEMESIDEFTAVEPMLGTDESANAQLQTCRGRSAKNNKLEAQDEQAQIKLNVTATEPKVNGYAEPMLGIDEQPAAANAQLPTCRGTSGKNTKLQAHDGKAQIKLETIEPKVNAYAEPMLATDDQQTEADNAELQSRRGEFAKNIQLQALYEKAQIKFKTTSTESNVNTYAEPMLGTDDEQTVAANAQLRTCRGRSTKKTKRQAQDEKAQTNLQTISIEPKDSDLLPAQLTPEMKDNTCEICGRVFSVPIVLKNHRRVHEGNADLLYVCKEGDCLRRFSSKDKLRIHMLRHAGIKNYVCSHCGVRKVTRNELTTHMKYHTQERTWPCQLCETVCINSYRLKMHMRTVHEGIKDFACSLCDRRFGKAETLKYHINTHTGEKPFECQACHKGFANPTGLRGHRKTCMDYQQLEKTNSALDDSCKTD